MSIGSSTIRFSRRIAQTVVSEKRTAGKPVSEAPIPHLQRTFLDSNILLYCEDAANTAKQTKALELVLEHKRQRTGVVSLQVLQEYFVNATRKFGLDPMLARQKVEVYARFHVAEPTVSDILAAIDIHRLHSFSYWDALVLRMARQTGCRVLLTEDMQLGQEFNGVKIVNPFL